VKQDDFITRQTLEAKDKAMELLKMEAKKLLEEKDVAMESLKTEAEKLLGERDDTIQVLQAEVRNPLFSIKNLGTFPLDERIQKSTCRYYGSDERVSRCP
jgi:hypothetical protein